MEEIDAASEGYGSTGSDGLHHLIEHIQDAVVEFELVDGEPIVRDVNRSFVGVFGYDRAEIIDARLNEFIVPEWLSSEARTLDERTASGEVNYRRVQRETTDGLREFLYRGVPYDGASDRTDGFAVYTDLTEVTRTERRLQVLNRVLRHNIRNGLQVIRGQADQMRAGRADTEPLDRIVDWADDLDELTDEVRLVTDFVTSSADEQRRLTAIDEVVGERVDAFERGHGLAVERSIGD